MRLSFVPADLNGCGMHDEVGGQIRIFYGFAPNKAKRTPGSCGRTAGWFGPYIQLAGKIGETIVQLIFRNVCYIPTISDSHCFALVAYDPITSHRLSISNCQHTNFFHLAYLHVSIICLYVPRYTDLYLIKIFRFCCRCVTIFYIGKGKKGKGRLWVLQHWCLEAYCTLTRMSSFIHLQRRCTHQAEWETSASEGRNYTWNLASNPQFT